MAYESVLLPDDDEATLRARMVEIGRRMYERGYIVATDGNISVRLPEGGYLITPSGTSKGFMVPSEIVKLDASFRQIGPGRPPSSEIAVHIAAYELRPDVKAVVHAHPPIATAFTLAGISLAQCSMPEVVIGLGGIRTTRYATPTTEETGRAVRELIGKHDVIMLMRHGSVTVGPSLLEAFYRLERLEHTAQVTWAARTMGNVQPLPREEIERLLEVREKLGFRPKLDPCNACGACIPNDR